MTPIDIARPVHKGTQIVAYQHGTAGCPVLIYANGQGVGQSTVSPMGYGKVRLNRALLEGEILTAKQDVNGYPTWPQKAPKVEKIPSDRLLNGEQFKAPSILPPTVHCQAGVRVQGLVEGVQAHVSGGQTGGSAWTPYDEDFVGVSPVLQKDDELEAYQDMDVGFPKPSAPSTPKTPVEKLPERLQPPTITEDVGGDGVLDVLLGNDGVTVCDLFVGAKLDVYSVDKQNNKERVGGGIATAACNYATVEKKLAKDLKYCAVQSLCELKSEENAKCVFAQGSIAKPSIREPLCEDDVQVIAEKTSPGSTVWLQRNKGDGGNATASGAATVINIVGGKPLQEGESIAVRQSNALLDSGWSADVKVKSKRECAPPPETACVPGKRVMTLQKLPDACPVFGVEAYTGAIPAVQDGELLSITNNTSQWTVELVDSHNTAGQLGTEACVAHGGLCHNVTALADLAPGASWSNIALPTLAGGRVVYACLKPLSNAAPPSLVNIEYEVQCAQTP